MIEINKNRLSTKGVPVWGEICGDINNQEDLKTLLDTYIDEPELLAALLDSNKGLKKWVEDKHYLTQHQDISHLATKSEVKAVEDEIPSLAGYAKESWVESKIPSLEGYAKESWVESKIPSLAGYAKESWVEEQGYLTQHQDISHLATKSELGSVESIAKGATKALSFYNYSHLISMLQSGSYDDLMLGQSLYVNVLGVPDLWVMLNDLPYREYTYTSDEDFINHVKNNGGRVGKYSLAFLETEKVVLTGYATEEWVEEQGYLTQHQDISHLATKSEVSAVEAKIPSLAGYAKESWVESKIPSLAGYAKESWVEEQGYLTQHQDISHLATKSEVSAVEAKIPNIFVGTHAQWDELTDEEKASYTITLLTD